MLHEFWRNELAEDAEDIDERRMLQLYEQQQTVRQRAQTSSDRTQRRRYLNRDREVGHARLFNVYFSDNPKVDAVGKKGLSPLQKCTAAIRQLAYGVSADHYDEYLRIAETTTIQCLFNFCRCRHGFPSMLDSLNCMHWQWKNCPVAWKGSRNDINVLNESPLFNDVLQGNAPEDPKRKIFKERQEAARKDVERAFGVLQSRWAMIKGSG
ncbi:uncharacterized protein LOC122055231 [Zingiber officinale]|uniref:uncharacterized protein LOC122055231 n=1 Tax=Zingiber officinale TaxID=94328 RepID=UPI001C4DB8D1|nr:uncharacterized protein LOC122055231 [Zingiber officinale]